MMKTISIPALCFLCFAFGVLPHKSEAQLGGKRNFEFLTIAPNNLNVALGGINITSGKDDASAFLANPALLHNNSHKYLSLSNFIFPSGINNTNLAYAWGSSQKSCWGVSMQYLHYGKFERYDRIGNYQGNFSASEYAFGVSKSHQIDYFRMGATLKIAGSQLADYNAYMLGLDIGGIFIHPKKDFRFGLTFRNLGLPLKKYKNETLSMPTDVLLGTSFKPEKMPIRLSITAYQLLRKNMVYYDPNLDRQLDGNGVPIIEKVQFFDKMIRHFVVGAEFILHENVNFRLGYNFLRRREMVLNDRGGLTGFSYGIVLRIRKTAEFALAHSFQHLAKGNTMISLSLDMNKVLKSKKIVE